MLTDPAGASMSGTGEIRAQGLEVAAGWSPPGAPRSWRLTAALFEAIATHDELLDRLTALPPDRLPALLASAARYSPAGHPPVRRHSSATSS